MRLFCLFTLLSSFLAAQIEISTAFTRGYYRSANVRAGYAHLSISSNLFPLASPETPVYVKVTLSDPGAVLSQTLVDLNRPGIPQQPIYLLLNALEPYYSIAPNHAISIVRWLKGERSFWLKITVPSSQWLGFEGNPALPTVDFPAFFVFGLSLKGNILMSKEYFTDREDVKYFSMFGDQPVSTEIRMDLRNSQLELSGNHVAVGSWIELFDHATLGVSDSEQITLGTPVPFDVSGEAIILVAHPSIVYTEKKLCPWVSWNERYDSDLVLNNRDEAPCDLRLTLRRADGQSAQTLLSLSAWQSRRIPIGELFPDWPRGSGASLEIEHTLSEISASVVTYLREGCSGFSPAASKAVRVSLNYDYYNTEPEDWGASLSFTNLVSDQNFFPAVVLVNLGDAPIDGRLLFVAADGSRRALETTAAQGLEPMRPRAILLRDLFSNGELPQQLFVEAPGGKLCGLTFLFNNQGEPAMTPAEPFRLPIPLLLPK